MNFILTRMPMQIPNYVEKYLGRQQRAIQCMDTNDWSWGWWRRRPRPSCSSPWPCRGPRRSRWRRRARAPPGTCWSRRSASWSWSCHLGWVRSRRGTRRCQASASSPADTRISAGCRRPPAAAAASGWSWARSRRRPPFWRHAFAPISTPRPTKVRVYLCKVGGPCPRLSSPARRFKWRRPAAPSNLLSSRLLPQLDVHRRRLFTEFYREQWKDTLNYSMPYDIDLFLRKII